MTKALIVVDVQNDFCEDGNLPVKGGNDVAREVAKLAVSGDYPVIAFTKDWHIDPGEHFAMDNPPDYEVSWPVHCVAGTDGAALHPALRRAFRTLHSKTVINEFKKGMYEASYSGFDGVSAIHEVPLAVWLKQHMVTAVDIVGLALDFCVKATALDAARYFETTVLDRFTAAVNPSKESLDEVYRVLNKAGVRIR